ncbi:SMP-30/gluconolactonase/LRE family protein [Rhodococcus sp. NPDC057529]|uniref:SMP-30/gluconolactonase/LRE family protein n=1 Tax=Rhodococcus sp. NPDC057529 TaxID=3346158 RepID=UPI00366C86B9
MTDNSRISDDNPLKGWKVDTSTIVRVGQNLHRPECILAQKDGTLYISDPRTAVQRLLPDGTQTIIPSLDQVDESWDARTPNGLALTRDEQIMIGDIGVGTIDRLDPSSGKLATLFDKVDGHPLGLVNFVMVDSKGRTWITVSTKLPTWGHAFDNEVADGYVMLLDGDALRIVAEGFAFTNEVRLDANEEWLYVAETVGRKITRLRVAEDGSLSDRQTYGPEDLGPGYPDGIAFDSYGNLWVTMVFADRLIAITPEQDVVELINDGNDAGNAALAAEVARGGGVTGEQLEATGVGGTIAPYMTSITFGGPDLKTVYLGSLGGTSVPSFQSPVAGLPMSHWS